MYDIYEDGRQVIFWGDNHWKFNFIKKALNDGLLKNIILIQLGDFGIGFNFIESEKSTLRKLNLLLMEHNVMLYVLRGNHDNPIYYHTQKIQMSNIVLLRDSTVIHTDNYNILTIGGGVSIDQIHRIPGKTWWKGEKVEYSDIVKELKDINIVASHLIPSDVLPPLDMNVPILAHYGLMQPWLEYELRDERYLMTQIYADLMENNTIEKWYYGHFHNSYLTEIPPTTFYGLNIDELSKPI